jgi:hypothetical protein
MVVDSMPAVVTSIEKPASVTVISQEVAVVVVSLLHASETGKASIGETVVCPLLLFWSVPYYYFEQQWCN